MNFTKLHALGNDFIVVDARETPSGASLDRLAHALCDRHFGAGADGVVFTWPEPGADFDCRSRIFNADGSEAEVSGNGTRCLAAWLDANGLWPEDRADARIETLAGVKRIRLLERDGATRRFEMEMGVPRFASADVPMQLDPPRERVVDYPLDVDGVTHLVTALSVGNPHCSLLVDDLDAIDFRALGARIERHPLFPQRTNVEFVEATGPNRIAVLLWERGVGETLSSGTGASAATVAAIVGGRVASPVTIETAAGELYATWTGACEPLVLAGPATIVYTGDWT